MPPVNTIVVQTVCYRRSVATRRRYSGQRLLTKALEPVNEALEGKDYLIGDFSAADVMLGHACFMSNRLGCVPDEMRALKAYVERVAGRPAFKTAIEMQ